MYVAEKKQTHVHVYLLVKSFEYTVYFIVMVYCVAFGCNNNSCSSKNISFFPFAADTAQRRVYLPIGTNDVTTIDKPRQ